MRMRTLSATSASNVRFLQGFENTLTSGLHNRGFVIFRPSSVSRKFLSSIQCFVRFRHCNDKHKIPVTYAGGVTVMPDLERIKTAGMARVDVTVGSALDIFGGNLAYKDIVAWHVQQQASIV